MSEDVKPGEEADEMRWVDRLVRLVVVAALFAWSFLIVRPFLGTVLWGAILAVAVYPLFARLERRLGGHPRVAAGVFVLMVLGLLAVPTVLLAETLVDGVERLNDAYEAGTLQVPPPPAGLADWPVIGGRLEDAWRLAHDDLQAALQSWLPHLERARTAMVTFVRGVAFALVELIFSLGVMGVFLATAPSGAALAHAVGRRVAGESGDTFVSLARDTTRSVAQGIVGVAIVQGLLAGIGCLAAGVPAAGLWSLGVLVLSVAQLSPILVLGPVAAYLFAGDGPTWIAVTFAIWSVFVGLLDNVLKPLLLGRGVAVPMLVVFLGAIGGLLRAGIIGLFIGPVILVVTFSLVRTWLDGE